MTDSTGFNPNVTGPLSDMRVVDLTRLAAGNMLSHMMADFGAEVIKIERPEIGDDLRRFGHGGVWWKVYGRSKKSVTLNLKSEEGKELLKRIIADSDVMIENFVPGTLENWGLGPDVLWRNSPDLVIARISGWGQTGPYSNRPGFGTLIEALSGFASMTGFDDKPPLLPPLALADMVAGLAGFGAVSTALLAREKGKSKGQVIDLSLFEPLHGILGPWSAEYIATGQTPRRMGNSSEVAAPRGVYLCKDGKHIAMSASMQSMWEQLAHAMGLPELVDDPRFKSTRDRVENQTELDEIVSEFFMRRNLKDNLDYCRQKGITAGEIADAADLIDHDYIKGREILVHAADKDFGAIPMHNVFPRLSATPGAIRAPAPDVGQHTAEILESMGINALQRKELARRGVI